jgi:SAM-dependent methyltransferase
VTGLPASEGRSNSFDYVPFRAVDGFVLDPACCSARDLGLARAGSSRVVILALEGRFVLARTDTGDFDEAEIRHVVHGCGQLYRDVSGKPSIDDFANDVVQLVRSATCRACPHLPTCCGCHEPAPRSYFLEDEAWLRGFVAALDGDVLDVGMGQVPYLADAMDRIRAGRLRLLGLDPDPAASAIGASIGVPVHVGAIESFDGPAASFDHAVAIRSLNHFIDPAAALAVLARVVKSGGTLTLIESLALPLVRTRRQADRSHQVAAGGFQHLRNWDSAPVLALLGDLPFEVTRHRPIGPDTCDQWIVQARRR